MFTAEVGDPKLLAYMGLTNLARLVFLMPL